MDREKVRLSSMLVLAGCLRDGSLHRRKQTLPAPAPHALSNSQWPRAVFTTSEGLRWLSDFSGLAAHRWAGLVTQTKALQDLPENRCLVMLVVVEPGGEGSVGCGLFKKKQAHAMARLQPRTKMEV